MMYANDYSEIPYAVKNNEKLRTRIIRLVEIEPILGKVLEGGDRTEKLREILSSFFHGGIGFNDAIKEVEFRLPRQYSQHENNNRVFPQGWAERLIRTSVSCFYNQAVLCEILESGQSQCFVAHSSSESPESNCSQRLAGGSHDASVLLKRLVESYREGSWGGDVKIPDHPHCTHTVQPI